MSDQADFGYEVFAELMGPEASARMREGADSGGFGAPIGKLAADYAFGAVWGRDGALSRKERSLAVISALIAQGFNAELKNHVRIGLNNGLSKDDLEGVLVQLIPYVGFPAVAQATEAMVEVLRERGVDLSTRTSSERGLL